MAIFITSQTLSIIMNSKSIIRNRNITLIVWLFFPVYIFLIPKIIDATGLKDWQGIFLVLYMTICGLTGYKLQKSKCPECKKYMFREGKMKYSLQKFLFRQCGQCGYKL